LVTIPARTLLAYRHTAYEAGAVTVRVGQRCAAMDASLRRHGAWSGVFVTAWNPFSRPAPLGWNRRMAHALAQRLRRRKTIAGHGRWRRWQEEHWLVLGDPRRTLQLARLFRQRAVVVVSRGQRARLVCSGRSTCL
jgi:hypothetical protein